VKDLLIHKRIENTMVYVNVEKALFQCEGDGFYCKTASSIEGIVKLIDSDFGYVTTFNGVMLFGECK